jgi:hypothetical protein
MLWKWRNAVNEGWRAKQTHTEIDNIELYENFNPTSEINFTRCIDGQAIFDQRDFAKNLETSQRKSTLCYDFLSFERS